MAEASSWLDAAYADFLCRLSYVQDMTNFFHTIPEKLPTFTKTRSCLSVGPARGDLDSYILSLLPDCESYTGIESSSASLTHLTERIRREHPHLKLNILNTTLEDWSGPEGPVDLVVAANVLYYFDEPQKQIEKFLQWLRPDGLLVIILGDHYSVSNVAVKWENWSPGKGYAYRQPNMKADLRQINAQVVLEEPVQFQFDQRCKNKNLANFFLERQATDVECDELFAYLDKENPTGQEICTDWITILKSPP